MSRNACHFYLPVQANRPLPLFQESNLRIRKRQFSAARQESTSQASSADAAPLAQAQYAVAQTIANTLLPAGTTVLLGFENLVHFLDWLDAEPMPIRASEE